MDELNPGIQRTVEYLNALGFPTVDSGDGETRDHECDRPEPYVIVRSLPATLVDDALRLLHVLRDVFLVEPDPIQQGAVWVQATFDPVDNSAFIELRGLSDAVAFDGKEPVVRRPPDDQISGERQRAIAWQLRRAREEGLAADVQILGRSLARAGGREARGVVRLDGLLEHLCVGEPRPDHYVAACGAEGPVVPPLDERGAPAQVMLCRACIEWAVARVRQAADDVVDALKPPRHICPARKCDGSGTIADAVATYDCDACAAEKEG